MNIHYYCHAPYCNKKLLSRKPIFGNKEKNWLASNNWFSYDLNGHRVILCNEHILQYKEILIEAKQQMEIHNGRP